MSIKHYLLNLSASVALEKLGWRIQATSIGLDLVLSSHDDDLTSENNQLIYHKLQQHSSPTTSWCRQQRFDN